MDELLKNIAPKFDLVVLELSWMGRYLPAFPAGIPKIVDLHNPHSLIEQRALAKASAEAQAAAKREAERMLQFEKRVASQCEVCVCVSEKEAELTSQLLGANRVEVV